MQRLFDLKPGDANTNHYAEMGLDATLGEFCVITSPVTP
jgi:hypothetical protein